jgi:hypothetical protein
VLFAFAYLLLRRVVGLLAGSSYDLNSDLEVMVRVWQQSQPSGWDRLLTNPGPCSGSCARRLRSSFP